MKTLLVAAGAAALLAVAQLAAAQAPPSIEDALRECRIFSSSTLTARTRQEIEAAQAIAVRDKEIERLRAELAKQEGAKK